MLDHCGTGQHHHLIPERIQGCLYLAFHGNLAVGGAAGGHSSVKWISWTNTETWTWHIKRRKEGFVSILMNTGALLCMWKTCNGTVVHFPVTIWAGDSISANTYRTSQIIYQCIDKLEAASPGTPKVILGDFNTCKLNNVLPTYEQYVPYNTRRETTRLVLC